MFSGSEFNFKLADALAVSGPDLFVANGYVVNGHGSSVTELDASTGALVGVLSGPKYRFDSPDALAVSGPDLFVVNSLFTPSITEVDATTGALVRVISGPGTN